MHAGLSLDLAKCEVPPECLAVLGRALAPSVSSLLLTKSDFAKGGGNLTGLRHLCGLLADEERGKGLRVLSLKENKLGPDAADLLSGALLSF